MDNQTENKQTEQIKFSEAWNALKESPKGLYIIFLLKFLESYSYFCIIYTLIIFLSEELKYSDEQAGWSYGIFGMCTSVYGFIFGGFVIDNLGVKLSLCLGCSILLLGRLLLVLCTSHLHILLILYTILPIGTCLGIPVMQIAIRRFTNEKSRSLAYSIFYAMMNVSAIFSGSAIDIFRRYVPDSTISIATFKFEITAYRVLFFSGACTTVISLFISIVFISDNLEQCEESGDEENQALIANEASGSNGNNNYSIDNGITPTQKNKKIIGPLQIIKEVAAQKSFWKFVYVIILLMGVRIVYRHLDATFPKYMMREFGKDIMYGSIIAINPFLIVILIPIFAPLSYQFSAYSQITFGAFITSLSPFFLVLGPHLYNSVMFVVILSIGEALWSPRLYEYTIFITEKGREGIYMALASSPMFIATLMTGATSGFFLETFCPEKGPKESWKMWLLIGLITLTSPILLFLLKHKIEVTKEDLVEEKSLKKKRLEEEKLKKKLNHSSYSYKHLVISNNIDIDYKGYKIEKQAEINISK
jgi:POT family proton-dependent oligopeptide transporter